MDKFKMKMCAVIVVGLLFVMNASAQQGTLQMNANYGMAFPTGSFSKEMSANSFRGWNANVMYGINDKFSVGLGAAFQDYYKKYPRAIYKTADGGEISAVITKSIQTIPILVQGRYNLMPEAVVQPYVGLGAGANMVMYRKLYGQFGDTDNSLQFVARPEAGIFIPFKKSGASGFTLGGAYNFAPYNRNNISNLNNFNVFAGIKFPLRSN
jgi:outer membrane protein W